MTSRVVLALLLPLLATPAVGGETRLEATVVPTHLAVGDRVAATLTLHLAQADTALDATFPDWSSGWGEAEVLVASPVERIAAGDQVLLVQRLTLTAFRPGTLELPPVAVRVASDPERRIALPVPLQLEVDSVLPDDEAAPSPAPPAAPRPQPLPAAAGWTIAAAVALAAAAGALAWRRGSFGEVAPPVPPVPPRVELAAALASLPALDSDAAWRRLSLALRRYLGRALSFPAVESSSTEIYRQLAARRLAADLVQRGVRVLRQADQVKFARRGASASELTIAAGEAAAVADALEAHLHPEPAAGETQGAV